MQEDKKRIFIDMDGTVARFHDEPMYLERMFEKDFFKDLKPFENLTEALQSYSTEYPNHELYILSAAVNGEPPYCLNEKRLWLSTHLPFIEPSHIIFTPIGESKSDYIPGGITSNDYLLDDYNINLEQWQENGGQSIKCKNNINHTGLKGPLWTGALIDNNDSPDRIIKGISSIVNCDKRYCWNDDDIVKLIIGGGRGR